MDGGMDIEDGQNMILGVWTSSSFSKNVFQLLVNRVEKKLWNEFNHFQQLNESQAQK